MSSGSTRRDAVLSGALGGWPSAGGVGILSAVAETAPVPALMGEGAKRPGGVAWTPRRPLGAGTRVTGVEVNLGRLVDWDVVQRALLVFEQALAQAEEGVDAEPVR